MKMPATSKVDLKIEASVKPSESPGKVMTAVTNVIQCSPEFLYGNRVIGRSFESKQLRIIYEQVRSRSVMGALRRIMVNNRVLNSTWFFLNKQAAAAGIVAVIEEEEESPLGPIRVTLECQEIDVLIDWLAPPNMH